MKLVKEHINEKFNDKTDPVKDMGIGLIAKFKKAIDKAGDSDDDITYEYDQIIKRYNKKYPGIDWLKVFQELPDPTFDMNYPIAEAFTDNESDPISDMGIGGFTYETLKPGAVIKPKRLGIAVTKNQSGQFCGFHSGLRLFPESLLVIYRISPYGKDYKDVYFKKCFSHDKEEMKNTVDQIRETIKEGHVPWGGSNGRMIVSKKKFDYRFDVIERGF